MAYDGADWHYGGNYPDDLPNECGGTNIGMFLSWVIMNRLEGDLHRGSKSVELVRACEMTGWEFLFQECDERLWEEDLDDEARSFNLQISP